MQDLESFETACPLGPALRADAQRNLERVLQAAREVFSEHGIDANVADVARRAGVGNATIFRRFPTKYDLIAAVAEQCVAEQLAGVRTAREEPDPLTAICRFMETMIGSQVRDRGLMDSEAARLFTDARTSHLYEELGTIGAELVRRAQTAGVIRTDVSCQDLALMGMTLARIGLMTEATAPGTWRRYLGLVMDGLRPGGSTLHPAAPSWDQINAGCQAMCADRSPARRRHGESRQPWDADL
jgi:AcrR family transcriptional regulator